MNLFYRNGITTLATCLTLSLFGESSPSFALITVPKAGSHLAIKALHLLTGGVPIWHTRFPSTFLIAPELGFLYTHLCLSLDLKEDYGRFFQLKKIVLIRDLRDVAISMVHQIKKGLWPGMSRGERETFLSLPFNEQLLYVINYNYELEEVASYAPYSLQVSLAKVAEQSLDFFRDPSVFVCRYEHLVGPEGGGSYEEQVVALRSMSAFLELPVADLEIEAVAGQLYGNDFDPFGKDGFKNFGSTFNKGKIGGWKKVFSEEHKIAFKKKLGEVLIALGYEPDNEW